MLAFYDFEIFAHDWLVVFKTAGGQKYKIHNDIQELKKVLKTFNILVGFNNYHYDDIILAELLSDKIAINPYQMSQRIISGDRPKLKLNLPTMDVRQELKNNLSLKEIECNLKMNIHETPVDFNIKRKLFPDEIERTFQYCENDVDMVEHIFNIRADYFQSKLELIKEFKLPKESIKNTRAQLVAKVLSARRTSARADRLDFIYDENLDFNFLPMEILKFYDEVSKKYKVGADHESLEKLSLDYNIAGVPHVYGFGGLHGAVNNLIHEGNLLSIDVALTKWCN